MPDQQQLPQIKVLNPLPRMANPPLVNIIDLKKDYKQVVVFGKGGVGKTDFCLRTTPALIEWVDTDRRANTISDKFNDGRVAHLYQPSTTEEIENSIAHAIFNLQEEFKKTGKKGTIVLDSYTAAKNTVIVNYLTKQNRPIDSKLSIDDKSSIKKTMLRIIDNLKRCELNLVVTAEEGVKIIGEETDTGKSRIAAVVPHVPKNEDELMYFCDYLIHIYPEDVKQDGTNIYVTRYFWKLYKSSTSRLPQEVSIQAKEDIDWVKMVAEVDGLKRVELKRTVTVPH